MNLPDFDTVNDTLRRFSQDLDAAELHGQLCGLLCTQSEVNLENWLRPGLVDVEDMYNWPADSVALFQALLDGTQGQVSGASFDFELLLPDDETGILTRLEALANWCQGFLLGISDGGVEDIGALPGELPEFVADLIELARVENYQAGDDEEEDENAYMELAEYLRVGVQLFYEELHGAHAGPDEPRLH